LRTPGGLHSVIDFKLPHGNQMALVREVQRDPISREVTHVDFQRIEEGKLVNVRVPLVLRGASPGVKLGGVLEHLTRELDVRCLPRDIPGRWEVDISSLNIGDSIHVRDVVLPDMEVLTDGDRVVCVVIAPTVEEITAPSAAVAAEGAAATAAPAEPAAAAPEKGKAGGKEKSKD
jgi:large subunit ribosomal protein L25